MKNLILIFFFNTLIFAETDIKEWFNKEYSHYIGKNILGLRTVATDMGGIRTIVTTKDFKTSIFTKAFEEGSEPEIYYRCLPDIHVKASTQKNYTIGFGTRFNSFCKKKIYKRRIKIFFS